MKFDVTHQLAALWTRRVDEEWLAGRLTLHFRLVLLALPSFRSRDGVICPSHESLASRTGRVSLSTVRRALDAARELGLLAWDQRRAGGRRDRRFWSSNLYILMPDNPRARVVRMRPERRGPTVVQTDPTPRDLSKIEPQIRQPWVPSQARAVGNLLQARQQQFAWGVVRPASRGSVCFGPENYQRERREPELPG